MKSSVPLKIQFQVSRWSYMRKIEIDHTFLANESHTCKVDEIVYGVEEREDGPVSSLTSES